MISLIIWHKYETKTNIGPFLTQYLEFYNMCAFMELLPCTIFVKCMKCKMMYSCVKIFQSRYFFIVKPQLRDQHKNSNNLKNYWDIIFLSIWHTPAWLCILMTPRFDSERARWEKVCGQAGNNNMCKHEEKLVPAEVRWGLGWRDRMEIMMCVSWENIPWNRHVVSYLWLLCLQVHMTPVFLKL